MSTGGAAVTAGGAGGTTGGVTGVVFDLDGVLLDSEHLWEQSWTEFAASASYRWTAADTGACQGMSTPEWSAYLSDRTRRPAGDCADGVVDRMAGHYRAGHVELLPGALALVTETAARVPVAMASSAPRRIIDTVLDTMGLRGAFSATVSSEEVPRGKPSPDVYATAAQRLGLQPARSFAVEDTSNGIRAAAAAGLGVIAMPGPRYALADDAAAVALSVHIGLAEVRAELRRRLDAALAGGAGRPRNTQQLSRKGNGS